MTAQASHGISNVLLCLERSCGGWWKQSCRWIGGCRSAAPGSTSKRGSGYKAIMVDRETEGIKNNCWSKSKALIRYAALFARYLLSCFLLLLKRLFSLT